MISEKEIEKVIQELQDYIIREEYKGYDPFDVFNSPFFKLPILRNHKTTRFIIQQIFRRIPLNLRPILRINKEVNPVTLGLCIQAYTYLSQLYVDRKEFYLKEIDKLIYWLVELSSKGFSGYCWGYNFDWEARYARIPKNYPTVVATGIIINSLYEYWKITKENRIKEIIKSSAKFILLDLNRTICNDSYCLSYSPNDNQKVLNATMKGARLLSQAYSLTQDNMYIEEAENIVKYVIKNQNENGSWSYSIGDARNWIDNFHTAYVLDALDDFIIISHKKEYCKYLNKGLQYYIKNLFTENGIPKYYSHSFYPVDATEIAQSIITLIRFNEKTKAKFVIEYGINALYSKKGYFYYQKNKLITDKTPYTRWSNAWFILSMSLFLFNNNGNIANEK